MHGDENTVGSYTLGGTESIMLAVRSAREWFRKKEGKSIIPEIVAPVTIHPAFCKAADYLGLKILRVGLDYRRKVDVELLNETLNRKTNCVICT